MAGLNDLANIPPVFTPTFYYFFYPKTVLRLGLGVGVNNESKHVCFPISNFYCLSGKG